MALWVAVLTLAVVGWWIWKSRSSAAAPDGESLEQLGRLHLSPQLTLHLVRAGGRTLLLAASPGGCVLLDSRPLPEVAEDARAVS